MSKVVTRIAPSPTGKLHIGTARTALFNYLYAKKNNGEFFLRFEDTDQGRSTKEFEKEIEEGLRWLGLNWDSKIVRQMDRLDVYKKISEDLEKKKFVYKKDRALWFDVKKVLVSLKISGREVEARREDKVIKSTLINLPEEDLVQGKISGNVEDFIIIRSNGIPTFHFAVVIDDNEFGVTHVIRGMDHFSNTPKHYLLYKILDYKLPRWAHIPLTLNEDKSKLSKRKGAVAVSDFRAEGYLQEALINFTAFLGWHIKGGDEREFFTMNELVKEFSINDMNKANAIFDRDKLDNINGHYIRNMNNEELMKRMRDIMELPKIDDKYIDKVLTVTKDRMKKLTDFTQLSEYFFREPEYDSKILIFKKSDKKNTQKGLMSALEEIRRIDSWFKEPEDFKSLLQGRMEKENLSFGDMFWSVRVALSGREQSSGPDELLWVLGKDESLKRLKKAVQLLS